MRVTFEDASILVAIGLWICVGHQMANGEHWALITLFSLLATANTGIAIKPRAT